MALGVLLALAVALTVIAFFFFNDLWMHEGVTVFRRRRVLRSGTAAPARILSADMLDKTIGRLRGMASAYSIIYEVLPPAAPPFRARGIEVMTLSEESANLRAEGTDANVQVKFDPESRLVVLVRVDIEKLERDRAAAKRQAQDALLRGGRRD